MRVVIVGGGIAGLVLASSLEKAGIDYVLLESRDRIDPQVGASISMNAASMRVLDQLGAADEIIDQTVPITTIKHLRPGGSYITPPSKDPALLGARFHYELAFMDRQFTLRAILNSIRDKGKIKTNQRVRSVEHTDKGVVVCCENGDSYSGDVVIGCDGVNSTIRSEMWRIADQEEFGYFDEAEKTKMTAEYSCLFGISAGVDNITPGDVDYTYDKGRSFLVISGKDGRAYWFFFQKMDKVYNRADTEFPRYSAEDARRVGEENAWRACHDIHLFREFWDKRISTTLVPMEECLFKNWSWGRMAVVGDGSHKMTANHGAAGNNAIESAVALANSLQRINENADFSTSTFHDAFVKWQNKRQARINSTVQSAAKICRMQAQASWKDYLLVYWVVPNSSSLFTDIFRDAMIGAEILDYLTVPDRSFMGNTPFDPACGIGFEIDMRKRLLWASPLFAISAWAWATSGADHTNGSFLLTSQSTDMTEWISGLVYLTSTISIYAVWLIESVRLANKLTPAQCPLIFAMLSLQFGPVMTAPVYFFSHFLLSDVSKFASRDARMTASGFVRTIFPILLSSTWVPYVLGASSRFWIFALVWVDIAQYALVKCSLSPVTIKEDRLIKERLTSDLKYIRMTVVGFTLTSAAVWTVFIGSLSAHRGRGTTIERIGVAWAMVMVAALIWILLLLRDLKKAGMLEDWRWYQLLAYGVLGSIFGGPVTAVLLGWWLREEILASRTSSTAFTREKYAGRGVLDVNREAFRQESKMDG